MSKVLRYVIVYAFFVFFFSLLSGSFSCWWFYACFCFTVVL